MKLTARACALGGWLQCLAAFLSAAAIAPGSASPPFEAILKIDAHSHQFEDHPAFHAMFRKINMRTINVCVNVGDLHLERMHETAFDLYQRHPDLYPFVSTFALRNRAEPGYADSVVAGLEETFARGAVGVKIWKEIGMVIKRPEGGFHLPDEPLWDPIYEFLARREKILLAHLAEPIDAFLPLDPESPHYGYFSRRKEYHVYGKPGYPSHADLMAARDRIMEKHPKLVVVGAHVGSLEHDLPALALRLDRYPNFQVEVSARIKTLARQPSDKVRAFIIKYQDRIMYGLDAGWQPYFGTRPPSDTQRAAHVNLLEARYRADYDYFAGAGQIPYDGRKVEALALPREVLEKFYRRNAERIFRLPPAWGPAQR